MLIESVPNVSEGRRLDVVDRLAEAISSVPGVFLLEKNEVLKRFRHRTAADRPDYIDLCISAPN